MNEYVEKILNITNLSSLTDKPNTDDINGIIDGLFPSIYIIIATIGAFLVTLIILSKLLYGPVTKMMKKRHDFIQQNIDDSINAKEESIKIKSEAKSELVESKVIAQEIISKSKKESEIIREQYINEGKKEAARLINEADVEISFKLSKMMETRNDDIIDVAMIISKEIITKNVDKKKIEKYLDSYIKAK